MADMTHDTFADYDYGKLALERMAPVTENFRLYCAEILRGSGKSSVFKITGAEFRVAKKGRYKGKLSIKIIGTDKVVYLTNKEIEEWSEHGNQQT